LPTGFSFTTELESVYTGFSRMTEQMLRRSAVLHQADRFRQPAGSTKHRVGPRGDPYTSGDTTDNVEAEELSDGQKQIGASSHGRITLKPYMCPISRSRRLPIMVDISTQGAQLGSSLPKRHIPPKALLLARRLHFGRICS